MKKTFLLLAGVLSIATTAVRAENTGDENGKYNRIYVGYAPSKFITTYKGDKNKSDAWHGFDIGWTHGINVCKQERPLFLEFGANMTWDFCPGKASEGGDYWLVDFDVPVLVTYRYRIGESNVRISPYFGVHFKVDLPTDDTRNIFRFGLQMGANVEFKKFFLGAGWDRDVTPIKNKNKVKTTTGGPRINLGLTF